jgi:hypothetical protein
MTRDEMAAALTAQPFDADVQVDVCGVLVDVIRVRYDPARDSVVLEVIERDAAEALSRLLNAASKAGDDHAATKARYGEGSPYREGSRRP